VAEIRLEVDNRASKEYNTFVKKYPRIVDIVVSRVVASHRKKLKRYIQRNAAGDPKKMLDSAGEFRVNNSNTSAERKGRHIHRSNKPYSGNTGSRFWNTIRYQKNEHGVYTYGFTSDNKVAGTDNINAAKGAEKWAIMLAKGWYKHPSSGRIIKSNKITMDDDMYAYFEQVGLYTVKRHLKMKPRPVVEQYFNANIKRMQNDFKRRFNDLFNKFKVSSKVA